MSAIAYLVLRALVPWLRTRRGGYAYLWVAVGVHLPWFLEHVLHWPLTPVVAVAAGAWVFSSLIWLIVGLPSLGVATLVRGIRSRVARARPKTPLPTDEGRRQALRNLAFPVVTLSLGGLGSFEGSVGFIVKRVELAIKGWPKALDGFRIGQITDSHVGDFVSVSTIVRAVDVLNRAGVDLQVMTGDLIDDLHFLEPTFDALERCRARHGMLCVLGNHEKMHSRLAAVLAAYAVRRPHGRLRLLVDRDEVIYHNGTALRVVGVDYPMRETDRHSPPRAVRKILMRASAERALGTLPNNGEPRLCLSHHPEFFPLAAKFGVHATISGHTHGGQIALGGQSLFPFYDYMLGKYSIGDSHLYVSGGTGHWWPYRLGVPTEVTVIVLKHAASRLQA